MPGGYGATQYQQQFTQNQQPYRPPAPGGQSWWDTIKGGLLNVDARIRGFVFGAPSEKLPALRGDPGEIAFQQQVASDNPILAGINAAYGLAARPVSAVGLFANPDSKDFLNPGGSWSDATQVSPGQAGAALPYSAAAYGGDLFGRREEGTAFGVQQGRFGGIDPTDPTVRQRAFEQNLGGKILSGATDAAVTYVADPLVVAGYGVKAANKAVRLNPANAGTVEKETAQLVAHAAGQRNTLGDTINQLANERDIAVLLEHPVVARSSNPPLLASLFKQSDSFDDAATVWLAARGDKASLDRLEAERPAMAAQIENSNMAIQAIKDARRQISKVGPDGQISHEWQLTKDDIARHKAIVQDSLRRDQWLAKATGFSGQEGEGVYGAALSQGVSPVRLVNEWRLNRAQTTADARYGSWSQSRYKAGPWAPVHRVLTWFGGEVPAGYVNVHAATLETAHREITATLQAADATPDMARHWLDQFTAANNQSERKLVLERMEGDLLTHVSAGYGMSPDVAKKLYDTWHSARQGAIDEWRSNGGYLIDPATGEYVHTPQLESQLAQSVPMMDFALMKRVLTRDQAQMLQKAALNTKDFGELALSTFNQVWKPSVLLRLGFLQRNVGESWIAAYVATGRFPGNPIAGVGNVARNAGIRIADSRVADRARAAYDRLRVSRDPGQAGLEDSYDALTGKVLHASELHADYSRRLEELAADKRLEPSGNPWDQMFADQAEEDIAHHRAVISDLDREIAQTRESMDRLAALRKNRVLRRQGDRSQSYMGVEFAGAHEGPMGDIMRQELSAERQNRLLQHSVDSKGFEARIQTRRLQRTGGFQRFNPGDAGYWDEAARVANHQFRNSPTAMRILGGEDPAVIAQELRSTQAGRDTLDKMGLPHDHAEAWTELLADAIHSYYPDRRLRQMISEGEVSAQQVAARLTGREDLAPIHGDELVTEQSGFTLGRLWDKTITKGFHLLGTMPEDTLARWPLYNSAYMTTMRDAIARHQGDFATMTQAEANRFVKQTLEPAARRQAAQTVRRTIYTIERRTNPAAAMRYISPFLQVTQNRFAYYGRQLLDNPDNMARLFLGWHAIGTDDQGRVHVHLPGFAAKLFGLEDTPDLAFNKQSLNLIAQGEPWYSPGFGPIATIPIAQVLRDNPDSTPSWVKSLVGSQGLGLFPNNYYGKNALDLALPTIARRFIPALQQERNQDWANTYAMILAVEGNKYRTGARKDKPTPSEIADRTDSVWAFRVLAAGVLPAQPQVTSPLQPMVDKYRQYLNQYGKDGQARFLQDYPEYFDFMLSASKSVTGTAPNDTAVGRAKQWSDLIGTLRNPAMAAMVTNVPGTEQFNQDAYQWEFGRAIAPGSDVQFRQPVSPQDAQKAREVERGWLEYRKLTDWRDAQMKDRGLTNLNQKAAADIRAIFEAKKNTLGAANNEWFFDYNQQDNAYYAKNAQTLAQILHDKSYVTANAGAQPWLASARSYLQLRQWAIDTLGQRKTNGGSGSITARSNADVSAIFQAKAQQFADADPQWSQWWTRWFAHDDLTTIPGSNGG